MAATAPDLTHWWVKSAACKRPRLATAAAAASGEGIPQLPRKEGAGKAPL
jgi:hypothetical protein